MTPSEPAAPPPPSAATQSGPEDRNTRHAVAYPDFRRMLVGALSATVAWWGLFVLVGYRIAELFPDQPRIFGYMGLSRAVPALAVALLGGYLADRMDRRRLILVATALDIFAAAAITAGIGGGADTILYWVLPAMFLQGVTRGITGPTFTAFEAELVPPRAAVSAATWGAGVFQTAAVLGPVLGGLLIEPMGATPAAASIAALYVIAAASIWWIRPRGAPLQLQRESVWASIAGGIRFVLSRRLLWTSMALDLFAVFFAGAVAILPLFAKDILHVDPARLGLLTSAPFAGAFLASAACAVRPPRAHTGPLLLGSVFGFGLCMIVFALSTSLWLSTAALFLSGVFDGVSVVIRKSILRLFSPNHMRGRLAAVNSIFIIASNELGEFESGMAAELFGLVESVVLGGVLSLGVVALAASLSPELRRLDFRELTEK